MGNGSLLRSGGLLFVVIYDADGQLPQDTGEPHRAREEPGSREERSGRVDQVRNASWGKRVFGFGWKSSNVCVTCLNINIYKHVACYWGGIHVMNELWYSSCHWEFVEAVVFRHGSDRSVCCKGTGARVEGDWSWEEIGSLVWLSSGKDVRAGFRVRNWRLVSGEDGEGNGNLLLCCLKNSMDREAWWAVVHGVARVRHDWATHTRTEFL